MRRRGRVNPGQRKRAREGRKRMTAGRKLAWPRCTGCLATPTVIEKKKKKKTTYEARGGGGRSEGQQDKKEQDSGAERERIQE